MRIIGIDPGSRVTGFGVVDWDGRNMTHVNHGVIVLDGDMPFPGRMLELGTALRQVFQKYQPDDVVIEKIFLGRNADSAFKLGHARGVCMYEAKIQGAEVFEYATRLVKKGVTGMGSASKEQVATVIQHLMQIRSVVKLDASDALAMACFHSYQIQAHKKLSKAVEL